MKFIVILWSLLWFIKTSFAASVQIKDEVRFEKYGVVTVFNDDFSFNREFKITEAEMVTLHSGPNNIPPGVTKAEWESGKCVVAGKGMEVGDAIESNGKLEIKYAEEVVNGRFKEYFVSYSSGDWSGRISSVTVRQAAVDDSRDPRGRQITERKPTQLVDGVLTFP